MNSTTYSKTKVRNEFDCAKIAKETSFKNFKSLKIQWRWWLPQFRTVKFNIRPILHWKFYILVYFSIKYRLQKIAVSERLTLVPDDGKRTFSTITEKIQKWISSAVYQTQHLLFSALTQPIKRTQKVNKGLPSSDMYILRMGNRFTAELRCQLPPPTAHAVL